MTAVTTLPLALLLPLLATTPSTPAGSTAPPPAGPVVTATPLGALLNQLPLLMLGAGLVLVLIVVARGLRTARRASGLPAASPGGADEFDAVRAEADEVVRLLAARAETIAARLENLIAEADDRLARLERSESLGTGVRGLDRPPPPPYPAGRTTNPPPSLSRTRAGADTDLPDSPDPINQQVYALSDKGMSPVQIAQHLGQHTGKVELILALRR